MPNRPLLDPAGLALLASTALIFTLYARTFSRISLAPVRVITGMLLWLALTAALAASGVLAFGPLPPPVMVLVTVSTALTTWFGLSRYGTALIEHAGLGFLIGFQAFRLVVELALWLGHRAGFVPVQMSWEQCNLDVLTGLTALPVAWLAHRGRLSRQAVLAWNICGLALLVNIVTVAILSMPTPLRLFLNEPANRFVTTWPWVWLPAFLVQAAWLGHLLVFRWLRRSRQPAR